MTERTPGPWIVDDTVVRQQSTGHAICWCARPELHGYYGNTHETDVANAEFIAGAEAEIKRLRAEIKRMVWGADD